MMQDSEDIWNVIPVNQYLKVEKNSMLSLTHLVHKYFLSKKKIKRIKNITILCVRERETDRHMYMNSLFDTCVEITFQRTMFNFSSFLIPLFYFSKFLILT